jgi:hypothetical protein
MRINYESTNTRSLILVWCIQFIGVEEELIKLMPVSIQPLIRCEIKTPRGVQILYGPLSLSVISGFSEKLNSVL